MIVNSKLYMSLRHRQVMAERFERTIRLYLSSRPLLYRRLVQDYFEELDDDGWEMFWRENGERYDEVNRRNELVELRARYKGGEIDE